MIGRDDQGPAPVDGVACMHECPDGSEPAGLRCSSSFGHLGDHRALDEKGRPWNWTDEPAPREPTDPSVTCPAHWFGFGCNLDPSHVGEHATGVVRRDGSTGRVTWEGASIPREESPTDGAELAELLGGIADDIELVTELRYERQRSSPIQRVARALSLLLREREANRATVTGMDLGRFSFEQWHADDGHDGPLPCPPWSEIGGDRRSRWSMSAVAIYDRAHAHLSRRIAERDGDVTRLTARVAELEADLYVPSHDVVMHEPLCAALHASGATKDQALDALTKQLRELRARALQQAETTIAPMSVTFGEPAGHRVAALLAELKRMREEGDGGMREAIEAVREHLGAPTPLDLAAGEVCALLPREYPDGVAEFARSASSKAALAALDVGEGDVIGARAQMADAAADLLAGMLACDAPADATAAKPCPIHATPIPGLYCSGCTASAKGGS